MNPRIEKKLSKRLVELLPKTYHYLAWKCNSSQVFHVGGGVDYWGEGQDSYTVLKDFAFGQSPYEWLGMFGFYPEGHRFAHYPIHDKRRRTGKRIIEIAKLIRRNGEREFRVPISNKQ